MNAENWVADDGGLDQREQTRFTLSMKSFVAMDGLYLLGFGPRTARAASDLTLKLYPELAGNVSDAAAKPCPD